MKKRNFSLFDMVLSASMAALAIVFDSFSIKIGGHIKIAIYGLPLLFAGILFGPFVGAISGLITGFFGQLFFSGYGITPTTPLWIIAPVFWGLLSGLLSKAIKTNHKLLNYSIIILITSLIVTLTNSIALYLDGLINSYPTPYVLSEFGIRILTSIAMSVIYIIIAYFTIPKLEFLKEKKSIKKDDCSNE